MDLYDFDGRRFELLVASDVIRDGMALEAWELLPKGRHIMVLEAFWRDSDARLTFTAFQHDLPFALIETFVAEVRPRLTPLDQSDT